MPFIKHSNYIQITIPVHSTWSSQKPWRQRDTKTALYGTSLPRNIHISHTQRVLIFIGKTITSFLARAPYVRDTHKQLMQPKIIQHMNFTFFTGGITKLSSSSSSHHLNWEYEEYKNSYPYFKKCKMVKLNAVLSMD